MPGDPWSAAANCCAMTCFNPRPTSMPGDPWPWRWCQAPQSESFNPRPTSMPGDPAIVPAPATGVAVSIRARHQCRAIPERKYAIVSRLMFQSAPDINAGRSDHVALRSAAGSRHVSIRARHQCRAIPDGAQAVSRRVGVSIRARHQCRAIRSWRNRRTGGATCFNPRPTSMPGDPGS